MTIPNAEAKAVLDAIKYVAVATIDENAQPWNTPVAAFHFDDDYTLYWASWRDNQHSVNIRSNSKVFVVAYDSTPTNNEPSAGVYMQGQAIEISDEQEAMQAALIFKDDPYNPADGLQYLASYPRRIYKFIPDKVWTNGNDKVDGNFIDIRMEAERP